MQQATKKKLINVGGLVLKTIGTAGLLSVAVLAPNVIQALGSIDSDQKRRARRSYYIDSAIARLKKQGYIEFKKNHKGVMCAVLTQRGQEEVLKYQLKEASIKKPKKWDKKYRVIIFDIKEWKRNTRNQLRNQLTNLGFVRLQNSVWVYPHECQEIIILLKSYFHLGKEVLYMTVDSIENDKWLKKEFGLI